MSPDPMTAGGPVELPFTHRPGRRERHLRRRHGNPLFAWPAVEVEPLDLLAAQRDDHEEMEGFQAALRDLVQRAIDLPPNAGSDQVLALKEDLERAYEQACGLPGDQSQVLTALGRLIDLSAKAVRRAAGSDPLALVELAHEEEARAIHRRLLEQPLVADLLHPRTPIAPAELIAALLTATPSELSAALEVFDPQQVQDLVAQGETLLACLAAGGVDTRVARGRLLQMMAPPSAAPS
jgi:hypothetical protein